MTFKPLLAAAADLAKVKYPALASPKVNGIRCLIHPTLGPVTRTSGQIPNLHIRAALSEDTYRYLDGEIITWTDGVMDDFNTVQSKVMSADGEPDFTFFVFDSFAEPDMPFTARQIAVQAVRGSQLVRPLPQTEIASSHALETLHAQHLDFGWEGTCLRAPDKGYKFGRSTAREGILLKLKPHEDAEGVVVAVNEHLHGGLLGSLSLRWKGLTFEVGTGFSDAQRAELWARRDTLIGQSVTFKYQGVGAHKRPLLPVFMGIRLDLVRPCTPQPQAQVPATSERRLTRGTISPCPPEPVRKGKQRHQQIAGPVMTFAQQYRSTLHGIIHEVRDDAGDVFTWVNGTASFETFDEAVARAEASDTPISPVDGPTLTDHQRLTSPRTLREWMAAWIAAWRKVHRRARWLNDYARDGGAWASVVHLEFLDAHYLQDFRIFASKRRVGGIALAESKAHYIKTRLGPNAVLSGEDRAALRQAISDMPPDEAFLPDALAIEERDLSSFANEMLALAEPGVRRLTPTQAYEYARLGRKRT